MNLGQGSYTSYDAVRGLPPNDIKSFVMRLITQNVAVCGFFIAVAGYLNRKRIAAHYRICRTTDVPSPTGNPRAEGDSPGVL